MNAGEILKIYLNANGYDGLCNDGCGCGCGMDDFAPCDGIQSDCQPAHRLTFPEGFTHKSYDGDLRGEDVYVADRELWQQRINEWEAQK